MIQERDKFRSDLYAISNVKTYVEKERKRFAVKMNAKVDELEKLITSKDK